MRTLILASSLAPAFVLATFAPRESWAQQAAPSNIRAEATVDTTSLVEADAPHGPSSNSFPSHHFQWAPHDSKRVQLGVNFGLNQLVLGGFNFAAELRYRQLWLEYSTGFALTLNDAPSLAMTSTEQQEHLHIFVPYTTGFGVGMTLLDELWVGVEFKSHRYDVTGPQGPRNGYQTYSIGPVVGYKFFIWRGLHVNFYVRYWPNVASSLDDNKLTVAGANGPVEHDAHSFSFFVNGAIGYALDL